MRVSKELLKEEWIKDGKFFIVSEFLISQIPSERLFTLQCNVDQSNH